MAKKLGEGWQIHSCYEAGASGYWLHRQLEEMGVKNLVIVPKAMGQGGQQQKTDRRDSGELTDGLDRYLRGQDKALSVVRVPSIEQEEKRALIRYHRQIMADRSRDEAWGKGLLCAQGIEVGGRWAKKRLVVAAARRLAIDLWRLRTGQTTAEKLGLILQSHPEST